MPVGITDLAHSIRKNSASGPVLVPLNRGQQLIAAAFGHKTLTSFQVAQNAEREPQDFENVTIVVPDYELVFARAQELGVGLSEPDLRHLVARAFEERLPNTQLHESYGAFDSAVYDKLWADISEDSDVGRAMADANYDGIDEVYFQFEIDFDEAMVGEPLTIEFDGHVSLGIDVERPYSGHKVNYDAALTLTRTGRCCFDAPEVEVLAAALDYDWGDSHESAPHTLAEALAEALDIEPFEAAALVDAEPQPLTGSTGEMVYGYQFDFTEHASPMLAAKLLAKHGSLTLEVGPHFFDTL